MSGSAADARGAAPARLPLVALCLLLLHLVTAAAYPWEPLSAARSLSLLNVDLCAIVLVALGLALHVRSRAVLAHAATAFVLLVPVFRFGATVMPAFYDKELDAYNDALLVPSLVHLLLFDHPPWLQLALSALALTALLAFYVLVFRCMRRVLGLADRPGLARAVWLAALALLLAGSIDAATSGAPGGRFTARSQLVEAAREAGHAWDEHHFLEEYRVLLEERASASRQWPQDLIRLHGADVFVLFIESYGRSVLREPAAAASVREWAAGWSADLEAAGFAAVSGACAPAISGGSSSLAHAGFLAGVRIHTRRAFDLLLASDARPLPRAFGDAGYRTVNVQPAMTEPWPEGAFFGFREDLFQAQLDYRGRSYHWGEMPDQFVLARVLELVRESNRPVFAQVVGVTTHAPFSMVPEYHEDWSVVLEPGTYAGEPDRRYDLDWLNYIGHPQVEEAYLATLHYSLRCAIDFTCRLPRRSLVMILGDHQPPNVGRISESDSSYDVPMHVLSNDTALLEPFALSGFTPGFLPPDDVPPFDSAAFLERFLRAFSEGADR